MKGRPLARRGATHCPSGNDAATSSIYFAVDDIRLFTILIVPFLLVVPYRSGNVERLSPHLSQHYGHTVMAGAADRIVQVLGADRWLHDAWTAVGTPLARLLVLSPERILARMAALRAAGPPERPMSAAGRIINRAAAVPLGLALGGLSGWAGFSLSPPVVAGLVLLVVFRVVGTAYNRRRSATIAEAMRANTRRELMALLDPPWADLRTAALACKYTSTHAMRLDADQRAGTAWVSMTPPSPSCWVPPAVSAEPPRSCSRPRGH
jgi:hypothetical protein